VGCAGAAVGCAGAAVGWAGAAVGCGAAVGAAGVGAPHATTINANAVAMIANSANFFISFSSCKFIRVLRRFGSLRFCTAKTACRQERREEYAMAAACAAHLGLRRQSVVAAFTSFELGGVACLRKMHMGSDIIVEIRRD
jgi:hypothetical protein